LAGELEGCQWRRSSQVELFALGFWFWLGEGGKGARLAGLANRVGVGVGGSACHPGGATGFDSRKLVMVGEPPAKPPAMVVPAKEDEPAEELEAKEAKVQELVKEEEPEAKEDDVEELLAQHQDLVDSMLAEVFHNAREVAVLDCFFRM